MNEKDNESTNKAVDSLINFGKALHLSFSTTSTHA
jgi:ABC-type transport system involved in Fe-S cluster assembly fused permease/ATPase subunit